MELIIGMVCILLVIFLAEAKTERNILNHKYKEEIKNTDRWRQLAIDLQRRQNADV